MQCLTGEAPTAGAGVFEGCSEVVRRIGEYVEGTDGQEQTCWRRPLISRTQKVRKLPGCEFLGIVEVSRWEVGVMETARTNSHGEVLQRH